MSAPIDLPPWADRFLAPALAVSAAFAVAGLVVALIGESPAAALAALIKGSLGTAEGLGFTLYYATNFIFTGLAVAVAFRAGLFNIGAEGQAALAAIGATLACLHAPPLGALGPVLLPLAGMAGAALFGAAWAAVPGWLQARRGSHVVITTIMFNFLASALLVHLLVNVMGKIGSMAPESEPLPEPARLLFLHDLARGLGVAMPVTPLNLAFPLALLAALGTWVLIHRSRLGYAIRAVGENPEAAAYAGIPTARIVVIAMAISGALAGGLALNEVMGAQGRLTIDVTGGYGFVGIAVALMGRGHPAGVVLAALLFGVLYQGGAELAFESPRITRDMVVVIGGVVILFAGALDGLFRRAAAGLLGLARRVDRAEA